MQGGMVGGEVVNVGRVGGGIVEGAQWLTSWYTQVRRCHRGGVVVAEAAEVRVVGVKF